MPRKPSNQGLRAKANPFAMRLDPRVKYMAELAARRERRSLTNFVEWAIDRALREVELAAGMNAAEASEKLWGHSEWERLRRLSEHCPDLLFHGEKQLVDTVQTFTLPGVQKPSFMLGDNVNNSLVEHCWDTLKAFASGKAKKEEVISQIQDFESDK